MSHWVHSVDEEGRPLTEQEVVGMTFFLIIGGYDTTVGSMGSSILALLNQPEKADRLRVQPISFPKPLKNCSDGTAPHTTRSAGSR